MNPLKLIFWIGLALLSTDLPPSEGKANHPKHASLQWSGSYAICQRCHLDKYDEVFQSVHYQWQGDACQILNGNGLEGKISGAMNAYCVNILGNFDACGHCHIGLGEIPSPRRSKRQLNNIDCFLCHHKDYRRVKNLQTGRFEPDPGLDMNTIVKTVHRPERSNCLQCHARGGGGDGIKRSLTLAHGHTKDRSYDVHMATTGANLPCQSCHKFVKHKVSGRGCELRPRECPEVPTCSSFACHPTKRHPNGHSTKAINRHIHRVACQTCHIPSYAKKVNDGMNKVLPTETHRDWRRAIWSDSLKRYEPSHSKGHHLKPVYRFYNGKSWVYNLKDPVIYDPKTKTYPITRPDGAIDDPSAKLYPFKYKTSYQPITQGLRANVLIAISTKDYFATGDYDKAVKAGLKNMGLPPTTPYLTVITDEYQMLNHQVAPKEMALTCHHCHPNAKATQMKLVTNLGYHLKGKKSAVCTQCHGDQKMLGHDRMHHIHVDDQKFKCSHCHSFDRPERTELIH